MVKRQINRKESVAICQCESPHPGAWEILDLRWGAGCEEQERGNNEDREVGKGARLQKPLKAMLWSLDFMVVKMGSHSMSLVKKVT